MAKLLSLIILFPVIYFGIMLLVAAPFLGTTSLPFTETKFYHIVWSYLMIIYVAPPIIWLVMLYAFSKKNKGKAEIIFNGILTMAILSPMLVALNWLLMPLWFENSPLLQFIVIFPLICGPIIITSYFIGLLIALYYKRKKK